MSDPKPNAQLAVTISSTGYPDVALNQWRKNSGSIPGAGSTGLTFDPNATPGAYSFTGTWPNVTGPVTPPPSQPVKLAIFWDSMGFNKSGQGNAADLVAKASSEVLGQIVTLVANVSVDGASSQYVVDTTGILSGAVASSVSAAASHVLIRFAHNDSKLGQAVPVTKFRANMLTIAQAFLAAGIVPILELPIYIQPGSYGLWLAPNMALLDQYRGAIESIEGNGILVGDRTLWVHFQNHPDQQFDGVHPWYDGLQALADASAMGLAAALYPVQTMPNPLNPDGSVNAAGYAAYWKTTDPRAWDKFLGPRWAGGPDDRDQLFTLPQKSDNQIYDFLGEGSAVMDINGSLGDPNAHDMHPVTCAAQVVPRNWGPTHPAVDPGINNYIYRPDGTLPPDCTDPMDPANNANDMATRILVMMDHRQRTIRLNDKYYMRITAGDYNSDFGTYAFHPYDLRNFPGLGRFQMDANYNLCWALFAKRMEGGWPRDENPTSPWSLYASIYRRGDPYGAPGQPPAKALGSLPGAPVWIHRANMINSEEALVAGNNRVVTTQPGDTSRDGDAFPIPAIALSEWEVMGPITVSSMNEFAAAIVWDTKLLAGKLVIFALQGWGLKNHSTPYYGFSNEGSWTGIRRIGEKVLGMKFPSAATFFTDAVLKPVQPDPGQINLSDPNQRAGYRGTGDIQQDLNNSGTIASFAKKGGFEVISTLENKGELYDFSKYIEFVWESYLEPDQTKWQATFDAMKAGTFPPNFSTERPDLAPVLVLSHAIDQPTCIISSGNVTNSHFGDWSGDFEKILIGSRSGTVTTINIAPFCDRWKFGWFHDAPIQVMGSFQVGKPGCNLTDLKWSRWDGDYNTVASADILPVGQNPQPFAQTFIATARADRAIYFVVTHYDRVKNTSIGGVYRKVTDQRIQDPVAAAVGTRQPTLHIADYSSRKIRSIQFGNVGKGKVWDAVNQNDVYQGCNFPPDPIGKSDRGYAGDMDVAGCPHQIDGDNVN